jgi:hypothetical protein
MAVVKNGKKVSDDVVAKSYVAINDPIKAGSAPKPVFEPVTVEADDGTNVPALHIVRWQ